MKLIPADPAAPLYGPTGQLVDPVDGIEVDPLDVFWQRRIRAGEAVEAPAKASKSKA
ncbi:hypothetical protein OSH11_17150 [Kaistia dalseonensis]|uniref:DUF2635 domain-containing protein n=1 Tax=Kaistia dalseonensis TaxID=410840 RepID=A0ABU0H9R2_9HYPH|nr:hypothetical protein [Kaistia dalseonensis]MCX5496437.1 hypothetical protein [Kaistia dalseonensis]MDQ0439058.1 hypothetical protein [Kaistia dalseonensis]